MSDWAELIRKVDAWSAADPDETTRAELQRLLAAEDFGASSRIASRARLEFGTAGLRGVIGGGPEPDEPRGGAPHHGRARRATSSRTVPDAPARRRRRPRRAPDERRVRRGHRRGAAPARESPRIVFAGLAPTPAAAFAVTRLGRGGGGDGHREPQPARVQRLQGLLGQRRADHPAARRRDRRGDRPGRAGPGDVPSPTWPMRGAHGLVRRDRARAGPRLSRGRPRPRGCTPASGTDSTIVYTPMHGVGGPLALEALRRAGFTERPPGRRSSSSRTARSRRCVPEPRGAGRDGPLACARRADAGGPGARQRSRRRPAGGAHARGRRASCAR